MHGIDCNCMEDSQDDSPVTECQQNIHEWTWDTNFVSSKTVLSECNLEVMFHPGYSVGTAAIRGNMSMSKGRHYYWEVKIITSPYGTDVMIGVGTNKVDLNSEQENFCSFLGKDKESWGLSYRGFIHHNGEERHYPARFNQGSVVGVHLDTWKGTLQFFMDKKPLGIAFTGLRDRILYPMVCSTAAKSKMRITHCSSMPASLQLECLAVLQPIQRTYLGTAFPILKYLSESIFADILHKDYDENNEDEFNEMDEICILDEFDFSLVGCRRKKKRLNVKTTHGKTFLIDNFLK